MTGNLVYADILDGEGETDETNGIATSQNNDPWEKKTENQNLLNSSSSSNNTPDAYSSRANTEASDQIHVCPYCDYSSVNEMRIQAHLISQHSQKSQEVLCPLCQEETKDKSQLEKHLVSTHNVTAEGLQRLLPMVGQGDWMMPPPSATSTPVTPQLPIDESGEINTDVLEAEAARLAAEDAIDTAALPEKGDFEDQYRCQTCSKTFTNIDALYAHQNELGHLELKQTPRGPGYLCWKKGCNQYFKTAQALQIHFREIHAKRQQLSISDRHSYKFRCSQCSLAFKTGDKLQLHSQYHLIRAATKCMFCSRTFRSIAAVKKHVESTHTDLSDAELEQYRATTNANSLALASLVCTSGLEKFFSGASSEDSPTNGCSGDESSADMIIDCAKSELDPEHEKLGIKMERPDSPSESTNSQMSSPQGDRLERNLDNSQDILDKMDLSDYKDQQFLEDYINSMAIAEGSYEDPGRKYKCHRCKVAFTKQSYLTAHNKTLLHRKGDKLSYPMEKYLDPNRPFKCDVCKESFTQKNILLVHYNSVSHLHKLKQITLGQSTSSTQGASVTPPAVNQPVTSGSVSSPSVVSSNEDKNKPFKCNICKVAYNQGSTLDIHIRSVAHQTRASKLQELALSGEVDISRPLIEQPSESKKSQSSKNIPDILQQKHSAHALNHTTQSSLLFQGISSGISGLSQLPINVITSATLPTTPSTETSVTKSLPESVPTAVKLSMDVRTSSSVVQSLTTPTKSFSESSSYSDPYPLTPLTSQSPLMITSHMAAESMMQLPLMYPGSSGRISPLSAQQYQFRSRNLISRFKPHVQRNLLENIGFECVMQFNEFNQSVSQSEMEKQEEDMDTDEKDVKVESDPPVEIKTEVDVKIEETDDEFRTDLPELNRCICVTCNKGFSSVWVLKAHQEEVHREVVPIAMVENFGVKFKNDLEKKQPKEAEMPPPSSNADVPSSSAATSNNDHCIHSEMPPPPPPAPHTTIPMDVNQMMSSMFSMSVPAPFNLAMNMHPPLMPMMLPMGMENMIPQMSPMVDNVLLQKQVQQAALQNQKRARTRINDEQLKILRAHFDINNSPSEEQVNAMSEQSGLPAKVIKHWFRNTLFKERQRNKDSPYNFSNPPSTTLDWEVYEKTGKIPAISDKIDIEDTKRDIGLLEDLREIKKEKTEVTSDTADSLPGSDTTSLEPTCDMSQPQTPDLCDSRDSYMALPLPPVQPTTTNAAAHTLLSLSMTTPNQMETMMNEDKQRQDHHNSYYTSDCHRQDSYELSPSSSSCTQKRANRTRFSDYQIKMLQEYFEQNAYPKDDELDHLSKTLNLSPRVIVVWFQNARQKARKIYENHPPVDLKESPTSPFQRTPGLNYQCRKCNSVFQKYYELIKHQKKNCLLENNKQNISDSMNSDDSNSTTVSQDEATYSDSPSLPSSSISQPTTTHIGANLKCDKCHIAFDKVELWQEHQNVHNLSMITGFPSSGAFGVLQNMAAVQQQEKNTLKRQSDDMSEDERDEQPRDKRLRTTILPEQLDYLYQKYQLDCNPSRKQLEHIAQEVGLKKRVVQVWFQNTRARERKGQFRAHQQLIHKRCPFCRALFRAKSALESHLATKHPEEMAKGDINIDSIPDAALESPTTPQAILPIPASVLSSSASSMSGDMSHLLSPPPMQGFLPVMHHGGVPPLTDPLQLSMKQFYEDSFKKYITELSATSHVSKSIHAQETPSKSTKSDSSQKNSTDENNDAPLDLSKPLKVNTDMERISDGPSTDVSERSFEDSMSRKNNMDDSLSECYSEKCNFDEESMTYSMGNSPSPPNHFGGNKRYRTQMTSLQVRVMKTVFQDYKTPTMAECEMLGREIGLQKRVVQVWFQNARAKEKKSKLTMSKTFGAEMDFNKPPEDCSLCNFKYSHKYTIQDHIFTKKHIDKIKVYIQSQSDAERELTNPSGMSHVLQQQQDLDKMRKAWDEAASQPHLAQLQAIGLNPLAMPSTSGLTKPFNPADFFPDMKSEKSQRTESDKKDSEKKEEGQVKKEAMYPDMSQFGSHLVPSFPGFIPGLDPTLLSYMYPGIPGYFPGMGMPFIQPGMLPGAEHLMVYDPLTFGTPLPLLQIPPQAIKDVTLKLQEPKASIAQYTQDCKSISSLKAIVSSMDYGCVREAIADVGYICKKCQMVYPAKEACMSHQRSMCFAAEKVPEGIQPMLKLEQIQYECKVCTDKFSTIQEYKSHCHLESHKVKVVKYQHKLQVAGSSNNKPNSIITSPGSSANKSNSLSSPAKSSTSKSDSQTAEQQRSKEASPSNIQSASKEISSMTTEKACSEVDNGKTPTSSPTEQCEPTIKKIKIEN